MGLGAATATGLCTGSGEQQLVTQGGCFGLMLDNN